MYLSTLILFITILASPSFFVHLKRLCTFVWKSIININLYKTASTDERDLQQQRLYTRIYIITFVGCLCVLLFYTAIIERSVTKTYTISSITDYEYLLNRYTDNINCPCTRISIPYNEFVTDLRVNRMHQACTTSLIEKSLRTGKYFEYINPKSSLELFKSTLTQLLKIHSIHSFPFLLILAIGVGTSLEKF